jgi:Resolvase, N terminal domain
MPSTNGHDSKRAILYARVSTDEQARSGYSLAQQIEALREYAAREGYEVLEGVEDPGQGGASLAAGRQADYGFRYNAARDGYTVHEEETRVVRHIFRMIAEGSSVNGARTALEAAKVPPRGGYIGSAPLYASAYSTTSTSRTPLRRWLPLSRLRWRHASTRSSPTASGSTTDVTRSARAYSMRNLVASDAT